MEKNQIVQVFFGPDQPLKLPEVSVHADSHCVSAFFLSPWELFM